MTAPDENDVGWAYGVLQANHAVRLNGSLEALWADRPRRVSLERSREFTGTIAQALADSAFIVREDFVLPPGIRVYGIHDIVLNCLCAERPGSEGVDIVFFSGALAVPLLRFAVQIMLSRLDEDLKFEFPDGHVGGLDEIAECALGYTIWHLIEDIPIILADMTSILTEDDIEKLATTLDGVTNFLFFHEVGHVACGHIALQSEIVQLSGAAAPEFQPLHEFEADAFAIRCIEPEYRSAMVLYARIFLEIIADLETLGFEFGPSHPKATARVRRLLEVFWDDIDDLRRGILTRFLENREAVTSGLSAEQDAARAYLRPAGGGKTRKAKVKPGDRLLKLPPKQICHFALEALISAYRSQVAASPG